MLAAAVELSGHDSHVYESGMESSVDSRRETRRRRSGKRSAPTPSVYLNRDGGARQQPTIHRQAGSSGRTSLSARSPSCPLLSLSVVLRIVVHPPINPPPSSHLNVRIPPTNTKPHWPLLAPAQPPHAPSPSASSSSLSLLAGKPSSAAAFRRRHVRTPPAR